MSEAFTGPELGRAVLELFGWKTVRIGSSYHAVGPDGLEWDGGTAQDAWGTAFLSPYVPKPHISAGDAIALLEKWKSKDRGNLYYKLAAIGEERICTLEDGDYNQIEVGSDFGDNAEALATAICRALVAWGEAR